jgi:hypothetical protein
VQLGNTVFHQAARSGSVPVLMFLQEQLEEEPLVFKGTPFHLNKVPANPQSIFLIT